jgi:hypothetical protein
MLGRKKRVRLTRMWLAAGLPLMARSIHQPRATRAWAGGGTPDRLGDEVGPIIAVDGKDAKQIIARPNC